jgi:hypothetical protein
MSENKIFIRHHLGLGDCIVHNGMVRKISIDSPNHNIWISCYYHNLDNVKFMYRDNPNIHIFPVSSDHETNAHISSSNYDKVISSFLHGGKYNYGVFFDDAFYLEANIDPKIKTENFYIERDYDRENEVYEELVTNNGISDYIFIHEKEESGIKIDRNKITNNFPIVYADKKYKTFELLSVIEKAKECHIISSSFLSLFMCKKYNHNIFAHMYADRNELTNYIIKNNIKVIL